MSRLFHVFVLTLALCAHARAQTTSVQQPQIVLPNASLATTTCVVVRVVDGDTFGAIIDGKEQTIRLLGIDAPESVDHRRPIQYWGPESSAQMKRTIEGQTLLLEMHEKVNEPIDRYGRLLCYAYFPGKDGACINELAIACGWARTYNKYPCKYTAWFSQVEREARVAGSGMWKDPVSALTIDQEEIAPTANPPSGRAIVPPPRSPYLVPSWPPHSPDLTLHEKLEKVALEANRLREVTRGIPTKTRVAIDRLYLDASRLARQCAPYTGKPGDMPKHLKNEAEHFVSYTWGRQSQPSEPDIKQLVDSGMTVKGAAWQLHIIEVATNRAKEVKGR